MFMKNETFRSCKHNIILLKKNNIRKLVFVKLFIFHKHELLYDNILLVKEK